MYYHVTLFFSFHLGNFKGDSKLKLNFPKNVFLRGDLVANFFISFNFLENLENDLKISIDSFVSEHAIIKDFQTSYLGQENSTWIALYMYCYYLGISFDKKALKFLHLHDAIAKSCCWWWPFENIVIISERPQYIEWNDDEFIDDNLKYVIKFCDGWKAYELQGNLIHNKWGEKKKRELGVEWLLKTDNSEVINNLIDICGYEKVMHKVNSKLIHAADCMELRRIDYNDDEESVVLLKVKCPSTNAFHYLKVPPYLKECETARQWTFGDEPIKLVMET